MSTIYQCFVIGESLAGWRVRRYSKKVFTTRAQAEAYMPEFVRMISDRREIEAIDQPDEQRIVELELVDP